MSNSNLIFKQSDGEDLHSQLTDRLYHIERAFIVRRHIKLHYSSSAISNNVTKKYREVKEGYNEFFLTYEETLLWFISVELWSRFLYPKTKRGLFRLVKDTNDLNVTGKHRIFKENHKQVIGYIKKQRNKYFAHADEEKWEDFPNVWDKEYDLLIGDLKDLMASIGSVRGSQKLPTSSNRPVKHTIALFDDLLKFNAPDIDVNALSAQYAKDVEKFLSE